MRNLIFGKKDKPPSRQDALNRLSELIAILNKKSEHLEAKIEEETNRARQYAASNKQMALKALKQKKRYQNNLKTLDNQIAALEQQQEALEEADTTKHILTTMKESNQVLKNTLTDKDLDEIQDFTEQMDEVKDRLSEFNMVMERQGQNVADDDDLMAELEALEQQELDKNLATPVKALPTLPSAPKNKLPKEVKKEPQPNDDDFIRTMQDWSKF